MAHGFSQGDLAASFVAPLVFDFPKSDLQGPLAQFQATLVDKDDIFKLMESITNAAPEVDRLAHAVLAKSFSRWWPDLKEELDSIQELTPSSHEHSVPQDKTTRILEELLDMTRGQQRILNNPNLLLPLDYLQFVLNKAFRSEPNEQNMIYQTHDFLEMLEKFVGKESKRDPKLAEQFAPLSTVKASFDSQFGDIIAKAIAKERETLLSTTNSDTNSYPTPQNTGDIPDGKPEANNMK